MSTRILAIDAAGKFSERVLLALSKTKRVSGKEFEADDPALDPSTTGFEESSTLN